MLSLDAVSALLFSVNAFLMLIGLIVARRIFLVKMFFVHSNYFIKNRAECIAIKKIVCYKAHIVLTLDILEKR